MMKQISVILLGLTLNACVIFSDSNNPIKWDDYAGKTLPQAVETLGYPDSSAVSLLTTRFTHNEGEPYYLKYFTDDALKEMVVIKIFTWKRAATVITAWAKRFEGEWIIFSSSERGRWKRFW